MALGMGGIGVAVGNDLGGVGYSVGFDVLMLTQRQRSAKLKRYRKQQSKLAWKRDDGLCQRCGTAGAHVHHVYGRGIWYTRSLYESADRLVMLCVGCHGRCHQDAPKIYRDEMIQVLELALEGVA